MYSDRDRTPKKHPIPPPLPGTIIYVARARVKKKKLISTMMTTRPDRGGSA